MVWWRRLLSLTRRDRLASDIDRELAFHLAERIDDLVASGMSVAEARREARRRLGRPEAVRERVYDVDVMSWLESLASDVGHALRALRNSPAFTVVALLSLALGIGANTAVFSLINAVMLRSLPVNEPERLVQLTMDGYQRLDFTHPLWEEIRDHQEAFAGVFAFAGQDFDLANGGVVRRVPGAAVSGDYFAVLGVGAAAGRLLGRADDVRGCPAVAVLSDAFWRRDYGAAADAVGRTLSLGGHPFEIVGVAAAGFSGIHVGRSADVFVPLCTLAILSSRDLLDARSTWYLSVFGRLRAGGSVAEAGTSLTALAPSVYAATVPPDWSAEEQAHYLASGLGAEPARTGTSPLRGQYRQALLSLLVVVGVVLLVSCANVAQLLLARATTRRPEVAMRLALGSGRGRLVRQLLTESLVLALVGAGVGVVFAGWASRVLVRFLQDAGQPVELDLSLDLRVLGFTIAVATATGLLFGLAPAWRSARLDPLTALRGAGRGLVGDRRQGVTQGIVVTQVALSLALVVTASLLGRSFGRLTSVDPGFHAEGVLLVDADWAKLGVDGDRERDLERRLIDTLRALPGVRQASGARLTPIGGTSWNEALAVEGFTPRDERHALAWLNGVSEGYFDTMATRLLRGRDLSRDDREGSGRVAVVNEALARRFFAGADPIGKTIRLDEHGQPGEPIEVVGLVEDTKYRRLDEEPAPIVYLPLGQATGWGSSLRLALRTDGPPRALISPVTAAMRDLDPRITLELTPMSDEIASSIATPRLLATLSGFFGLLALLLAVTGLYGVMAYGMTRRRNEIGIRIALGAARPGILGMVAREVGRLIAFGLALGALFVAGATRLVASFLYEVEVWDPASLAFSTLVLAAAALAAGLLPAWRAAGVDPMSSLREE